MSLTKCVVHFRQQNAKITMLVMHMPKTDGIKDIAKHARKALQPDRANLHLYVTGFKCASQPRHQIRAVTRTVVASTETNNAIFIDSKNPTIERTQFCELIHAQSNTKDAIHKSVNKRSESRMHDTTATEFE
jgi:hypothetical protein